MKFPYGMSDFRKIVTQGFYYCDRSDRISLLERGQYLLFLRPRRFGKSLLLSMLANYYDLALQDRFDEIFGSLKIGQQPTPLHNQYFILKWDFSCVDPGGDVQQIKRAVSSKNKCAGLCLYSLNINYQSRSRSAKMKFLQTTRRARISFLHSC